MALEVAKAAQLQSPGGGRGDADRGIVTFNAIMVEAPGGEAVQISFVLSVDDAQRLGQDLTHLSEDVLARMKANQDETIRRIEESSGRSPPAPER